MRHHSHIDAARAALARAAWVRGTAPAYCETAVADLLADIRHLCAAAGIDFDRCDRVAALHVRTEDWGAA